jgi:hypothetical protein
MKTSAISFHIRYVSRLNFVNRNDICVLYACRLGSFDTSRFEAGKELDKIVWFGTLPLVPFTKLSEGHLNYAVR